MERDERRQAQDGVGRMKVYTVFRSSTGGKDLLVSIKGIGRW